VRYAPASGQLGEETQTPGQTGNFPHTRSNGEYVHPARNDPRTVDELIAAALMAPDYEDDGFWDVIAALHWRGSKEVLI